MIIWHKNRPNANIGLILVPQHTYTYIPNIDQLFIGASVKMSNADCNEKKISSLVGSKSASVDGTAPVTIIMITAYSVQ